MGAEPMRTASTAERSLLAKSSRSRSSMAIMVGTEVRKATRCFAAASTYPLVVNCGSRTMVSPWCSVVWHIARPFM